MQGLFVHSGNRLEILADELARLISRPLTNAIAPEVIVVQSRGMARWLSLQLASRNGVSANCRFPFPNAFLESLYTSLFPDGGDPSAYDTGHLAFRLMALLSELSDQPGFEASKTYLTDDPVGLKRYQLALKIADRLDQYQVFRPKMVLDWEKGIESHWQARLWRRLSSEIEAPHRARMQIALLRQLRADHLDIKIDTGRVFMFGISYLPPFHLSVLAAISRHVELHLFLLNPCMAYWADIVSEGEIRRIRKKYPTPVSESESLHLHRGNRLLASMGIQGRDFGSLISGMEAQFSEYFVETEGDGLLHEIQRDILLLEDRGTGSDSGRTPLLLDKSIQIHSCHSPMREIEILHDQLMDMLEEDPDLLPGDILVMTPDMDTYAPLIRGIFESLPDENPQIPFAVSDQTPVTANPLLEGFIRLLEMKEGRLGVREVMALLQAPGVKEKFGIRSADIPVIEYWLRDTRVCWGRDEQSRLASGGPAFRDNSWQSGIDRMLLGVALHGEERRLFSGILPYDSIEGQDVGVLGCFIDFVEWVFEAVEEMRGKKNLGQWGRWMEKRIAELYEADEETQSRIQVLREMAAELGRIQDISGFDDAVALEVVRSRIFENLHQNRSSRGFIGGGVTFCAMLPMRSIPSKVVCMIGMNGDAFPRDDRQPGFDLLARHPKAGDRSRRMDDKYLFLEALISARSKLYISYTGQSVRDNTPIPPSVLVSELLDYITEGFHLTTEQLVTVHRLQAFSPAYYSGKNDLFSYSQVNWRTAQCLGKPPSSPAFFPDTLPEPPDSWKSISLEALHLFFSHPVKNLLNTRLGLFLEAPDTDLEDREVFALDPLARYHVAQKMLEYDAAFDTWTDSYRLLKAGGTLPVGHVGEVQFREMDSVLRHFLEKRETLNPGTSMEPTEVDLSMEGFRLHGKVDNRTVDGIFKSRFANIRPADILTTWISHLALCAWASPGRTLQSRFVGNDGCLTFSPVKNSRKLLGILLTFYWKGLAEPVPLFPASSLAYAKTRFWRKRSRSDALKAARRIWDGSDFFMGECQDPYHARCFGETDPIGDAFAEVAETVYAPLMESCTEKAM